MLNTCAVITVTFTWLPLHFFDVFCIRPGLGTLLNGARFTFGRPRCAEAPFELSRDRQTNRRANRHGLFCVWWETLLVFTSVQILYHVNHVNHVNDVNHVTCREM